MKLKPKTFNLNLIYECPECGSSHWFNEDELKGLPILFCCGQSFEILPVRHTKINLVFNTKPDKKAVDILKGYGYTVEEINKSGVVANSTEDFVKQFLAEQV